jgi:hypothetical protein
MSAVQWFLLGMMVAWTPSLILLALILSRTPEAEFGASQGSQLPREH